MKCTKCKFENNAEAKFCVKCGSPLVAAKPKQGIIISISPQQKKLIMYAVVAAVVIIGFFLVKGMFVGKQDMVFVHGGTFTMGGSKSNEIPKHKVTLSDFKISKYEITNEQYCEFLNDQGNQKEGGKSWLDIEDGYCLIVKKNGKFIPKANKEQHPVIEVTWFGARAYCNWAGGRLPTEAEWEYAARGGEDEKGYKYAGSDDLKEVAWYHDNSEEETHQVGTKKANELGIYDMSGNVWEWCSDWYDSGYYSDSPKQNPQGPKKGSIRVRRGGGWGNGATYCRVAFRSDDYPTRSTYHLGFRLVIAP